MIGHAPHSTSSATVSQESQEQDEETFKSLGWVGGRDLSLI